MIGRAVGDVIDENHGERPLDIYSANKGAAEKYYRIYHRVHDLKTVMLRFANLYGPYGKAHAEFGFINYFIGLAHNDQEITVYGSGTQRRNVLHAEDAAEAMYMAAANPKLYGEAYFATHDEHVSVIDIAKQIVNVFGRGKLTHVEWPEERKRIEVDDQRISSELFRGLSGWKPRYSFLEGLERTRAIMEQK